MPRPGRQGPRRFPVILYWGICIAGFVQGPISAEEARALNSTPLDTGMRSAVQNVVRETVHYDPTVREKALAAKAAAPNDVTTLETVTVVESSETPGFRAYREEKRRAAEAAKPSVARGISRQIRPNMTVGITPYREVLPFGDAKPRWTLVNLRF